MQLRICQWPSCSSGVGYKLGDAGMYPPSTVTVPELVRTESVMQQAMSAIAFMGNKSVASQVPNFAHVLLRLLHGGHVV